MMLDMILITGFTFLGIMGIWIARDDLTCRKRFTETVEGEIIHTTMTHHAGGNRMLAKFRYTYGGQTYEAMAEDEFPKEWLKEHPVSEGLKLDIFVNPKKPKEIRLQNQNETFMGIVLLVFGLFLLLAAGADLVSVIRSI